MGNKPAGWQWNWILDAVLKILKYKKRKIDHVIYIKVLSDRAVSYLMVSFDDVLFNIIIGTSFLEPIKLYEEAFDIKVQ